MDQVTQAPIGLHQSRVRYDLGLREATVVTRDYFNSRRLMEVSPAFPIRIYTEEEEEEELGQLIREPPSPICSAATTSLLADPPGERRASRSGAPVSRPPWSLRRRPRRRSSGPRNAARCSSVK